jgi:hypothetical protein
MPTAVNCPYYLEAGADTTGQGARYLGPPRGAPAVAHGDLLYSHAQTRGPCLHLDIPAEIWVLEAQRIELVQLPKSCHSVGHYAVLCQGSSLSLQSFLHFPRECGLSEHKFLIASHNIPVLSRDLRQIAIHLCDLRLQRAQPGHTHGSLCEVVGYSHLLVQAGKKGGAGG